MYRMVGKIVEHKDDEVPKGIVLCDTIGMIYKLNIQEFADILHEVENVRFNQNKILISGVNWRTMPMYDTKLCSLSNSIYILGVLICGGMKLYRVLMPSGTIKVLAESALVQYALQKRRYAIINAKIKDGKLVPRAENFIKLLYSASTILDMDFDVVNGDGYICRGSKGGVKCTGRVVLSDKVVGVAADAFKGHYEMTAFTAKNLRVIGINAFYNCASLKTVILSNTLRNIGIGAFSNCIDLTEIDLGTKVKNISEYAFSNCTSLKKFVVGDAVTSIGTFAFYDCHKLESLKIGKNVKHIGAGAFMNCLELKAIKLPDSLQDTILSRSLFQGCRMLNSVTIPDAVKKVDVDVFTDCPQLSSVKASTELHLYLKLCNHTFKQTI